MIIERNEYLNQLLAKRWNGKVKILVANDAKPTAATVGNGDSD